jgi:uncharacterized protein with von Willebrand factor type A (vWA) domain
MALIATLERFVEELRDVGLPISISEKIDAAAALGQIDLTDREAVKSGLAVTLVKTVEHESAFDTLFDIVFGTPSLGGDGDARVPDDATEGDEEDGDPAGLGPARPIFGAGGFRSLGDTMIRGLVIDTLDSDEQGSLLQRQLAEILVERHAGIQPGRAVAGTYYLFRAMRELNPDAVLTELAARAEQRKPYLAGDALAHRLIVEEHEQRLADFRRLVEAEIRRRLVSDRGADAVARTLRHPLPEDIDFLTAASAQFDQLRDVLQPLSRKLEARLVHKRKHGRRGAVDFRATSRGSMSTGGFPIDVRHHSPRPTKPELVVLADISGSVSTFAAFTLQLAFALRSEFSRVRCYVFIDGLDEVTGLLEQAHNILDITSEINRRGLGVWFDGRSDYSNAIETFWHEHGGELRTRTTLLILGDARSNHHAPRAELLGKIAGRAGHTFWLNPESKTAWDGGDSVIGQYAPHCDEVVECRNLRQLRAFVEQLS